jgi:flagellar basal body-associated protein FliL
MVGRIIKKKKWSLIMILAIAGIVSLLAITSASYYFNFSKKQAVVNHRTDNKSSMSYVPTLQMLASLIKIVRSS